MLIRYHEPIGEPWKAVDPVPQNVVELDKTAPLLPKNFNCVDYKLFRSGLVFPSQVHHLRGTYGIQHIVSLVPGDWLSSWFDDASVTIHQFPFHRRREMTPSHVNNIVKTIAGLEGRVLVHCKKGETRTGMVCAAYRMQRGVYPLGCVVIDAVLHGMVNGSALRDVLFYYPKMFS
ncbi:MAG TPA: hypothetical protein VJB87_03030 [Candidatus Nanoarchaeia archaeon]|nr:hypothetical protein [Candidatus Nanoarchaeia archaeon]